MIDVGLRASCHNNRETTRFIFNAFMRVIRYPGKEPIVETEYVLYHRGLFVSPDDLATV